MPAKLYKLQFLDGLKEERHKTENQNTAQVPRFEWSFKLLNYKKMHQLYFIICSILKRID